MGEILEMDQGTDEWLQARLGKVTASRFKDAIAGGQGKTRKAYMYKLMAERLSGQIEDSYQNDAMQWGNDNEDKARSAYEFDKDIEVSQIGFVTLNDDVGASPDGVVGEGLLEIKCPKTSTFIEYKLADKLPAVYTAQVQGQLWVCEKAWCDFVVYDPRIKNGYFCKRVERDEKYISELKIGIEKFVKEMKELVEKFN